MLKGCNHKDKHRVPQLKGYNSASVKYKRRNIEKGKRSRQVEPQRLTIWSNSSYINHNREK